MCWSLVRIFALASKPGEKQKKQHGLLHDVNWQTSKTVSNDQNKHRLSCENIYNLSQQIDMPTYADY